MKNLCKVVKKGGSFAHLTLAILLAGVAAQASADEPRMGAHLIGTIEGPAVITDPAAVPTQPREAPALRRW